MRLIHRLGARLAAALALATIAVHPAAAQSLLRDTETEAFFQDLAAPLVKAADLPERNVEFALLSTRSINAFVAGGQIVYLHAGLIEKADTAAEVQGVIAHELGHITGGHIIRQGEGARAATNISLLSLLAGLGAVLAGAGDAGMAAMMMGQRAAPTAVARKAQPMPRALHFFRRLGSRAAARSLSSRSWRAWRCATPSAAMPKSSISAATR